MTKSRHATSAPVCITGMHRSGTSMVARILGTCGLDLGPADELMGPRPDNPDGFFENVRFVLLSDGIFAAFGGLFDNPPEFPADWVQHPRLDGLRLMARDLVTSWSGRSPWGWKDPRCSMTLPFWQALIPDLRVVVCLRHPQEVFQSLERRGYGSPLPMEALWLRYKRSLLSAGGPASRIVTHYDAYFFDAEAEIRRLLDAVGLKTSDTNVAKAADFVSGKMRHHGGSDDDRGGEALPAEVLALYGALADEAGEVFRAAHVAAASHPAEDRDNASSAKGDARRNLAALRDEFSATLRDLASVREKLKAAEGELASLKAEHEGSLEELRDLRASVVKAAQVSEELRTRLSRETQERLVQEDACRRNRQELDETRTALSREAQERPVLEDACRTSRQELDEIRAALSQKEHDRAGLDEALSAARDELAVLRAATCELDSRCLAAETALTHARENEERLLRSLATSRREMKDFSLLREKVSDLEALQVAQEARLARHGAVYADLLRVRDASERDLVAARSRIAELQARTGAAPELPAASAVSETAPEPEKISLARGSIEVTPAVTSTARNGPSVLFVSHDANPHGAQIFLLQFLEWMKKNSDIPMEILLGRGGMLAERFAAVGRTSMWPAENSGTVPLPESDPLMRRFREAGVGLVYSNTIVNGRILAGLSRLGSDVISHPHELGYWMQNRLPDGDLRLALDLSNHFVACSRAVRRSLVESLDVPADRVSVVHEFIPVAPGEQSMNTSTRFRVRAELGAESNAQIVCGSGTTDWRKAPDLFVQVARRVQEGLSGRPVHFIWVGGDAKGTEFTQLRHDVEKSGLTGLVHFLGHRPNPHDYFAASDVFVLPSREDPFPLVNLEAASHGVPIVCFEGSGGSGEFVEEDAGFVVPYLDVEAMTGRVVEILTTPWLRDQLGRRAAEKVRERHDIEVVAPKLLELIESRLRTAAESRA